MEGIAAEALHATGCDDPPVDALELAACLGLTVRAKAGRATLTGRTIRVDARLRGHRLHEAVAHELGHYVLIASGEHDYEDAASYVGDALLLPRAAMCRALRECLALADVAAMHPNVSTPTIVRRLQQITGLRLFAADAPTSHAGHDLGFLDKP